MKALLSTIIVLLLFPVAAFSLHAYQPFFEKGKSDSTIALNFSAETGLLFGSIDEYAFSGGSKISELNWRLDPLVYAGGTAALQYQHLVFSAGFWSGFQQRTGIIEDSDFIDPYDLEVNDTVTPVPSRTYYSRHDNIIHKAYFFDFNAGYLVDLGRYGIFSFVGGFNYFNIKMSARNGSLHYPAPYYAPNIAVYGDGIVYEQKVYIPYIGAAIALRRDLFYARGAIYFSNWLSCDATDNHLVRKIDFHDSIYAAIYLHLMLGAGVQINQYVSIELAGSFSYIPVTRGDEYIVDHNAGTTSPTYAGITGIGMQLWELRLSGVIKL